MFELSSLFAGGTQPAPFNVTPDPPGQAQSAGEDAALARWLTLSLDHAGRGMVLVTGAGQVLHANRPARSVLTERHPLHIEHGRLRARCAQEDRALADALHAATHRGLRRMLNFSGIPGPTGKAAANKVATGKAAAQAVHLAVLPLEGKASGSGVALVSLPQPERRQDLSVQCFARQHQLTSAETCVLQALLQGQTPSDIAHGKAVALCTVRTQLSQLRWKTGSNSIRQLLDKVRALPPMMRVAG